MGVSVGMPGNQNVHHVPLQGGRISSRIVRLCHWLKEYSIQIYLRARSLKTITSKATLFFFFFLLSEYKNSHCTGKKSRSGTIVGKF